MITLPKIMLSIIQQNIKLQTKMNQTITVGSRTLIPPKTSTDFLTQKTGLLHTIKTTNSIMKIAAAMRAQKSISINDTLYSQQKKYVLQGAINFNGVFCNLLARRNNNLAINSYAKKDGTLPFRTSLRSRKTRQPWRPKRALPTTMTAVTKCQAAPTSITPSSTRSLVCLPRGNLQTTMDPKRYPSYPPPPTKMQ